MSSALLWIILGLLIIILILMAVLLFRGTSGKGELLERAMREELRSGREEAAKASRDLREEISKGLRGFTDSSHNRMETLRNAVDDRLKQIQENNEKRLEEMRKTVDERLQTTLANRLGESFNQVSERLLEVHKGLGEMQKLAEDVGDFKRMLTNVKTRGVWGEIQLEALIEQILTKDQYGCNVCVNEETNNFVEYAVRLPGPENHSGSCVWLPIDSKFPMESYLRAVEAAESADPDQVHQALKSLADAVRKSAKDIHDKYIAPPRTTDFAVMFLPTESLYAEVVRQPGLIEELQQTWRVVVAGPTTLSALLNSLRMGFKTLALQEKASEVWTILAAVKAEFAKFENVFEKVNKQLNTVCNTLEEKVGRRTRAMERKLRSVEELSPEKAAYVLDTSSEEIEGDDEN